MTAAKRSHLSCLVALAVLLAWLVWLGAFGCATVLGVAVAVWAVSLMGLSHAHRQAERVARGCCPLCGYDLRHTPHRCSECGHVPPHGVRIAYEDWLAAEFGTVCRTPEPPRSSSDSVKDGPADRLDNPTAEGNNPPK